MRHFLLAVAIPALLFVGVGQAEAATIGNFQSAFRTEGADLVFTFDLSGWDGGTEVAPSFNSPGATFTEFGVSGGGSGTGLGTIFVDITRAGAGAASGSFHAFFDLEIDASTNTFLNEFGAVVGAGALGNSTDPDSFEIDVPSILFGGDIEEHFEDGALDDTNDVPSSSPNDVAVAMGWDLVLDVGESAMLTLVVSEQGLTAPGSTFALEHTDPDSSVTITYSGALTTTSAPIPEPGAPVPEPGTLLLLGSGVVGMGAVTRRRSCRK